MKMQITIEEDELVEALQLYHQETSTTYNKEVTVRSVSACNGEISYELELAEKVES
jgi:hypothetical protein